MVAESNPVPSRDGPVSCLLRPCTAMASIHLKTPVQEHPLLPDEAPPSSRTRRRGNHEASPSTSSSSNYLTLKAQLEQQQQQQSQSHTHSTQNGNWDGSVRGYGKAPSSAASSLHRPKAKASISSLSVLWDNDTDDDHLHAPPAPPLFIVSNAAAKSKAPSILLTRGDDDDDSDPTLRAQVLDTRWHERSDAEIQSAIADLTPATMSPAETPTQPYHSALRILSAALDNLTKARVELEELRRRERERRERAESVVNEMDLATDREREIARRVVRAVFSEPETDVDANAEEARHHVVRESNLFSLKESLTEALEDDVAIALPRSLPKEDGEGLVTPTTNGAVQFPSTSTEPDNPTTDQTTVRPRADRPSMGEWVGTWWTKGRTRSVSKPTIPSTSNTPESPPAPEADDSTVGASPRPPPANGSGRRRTVKSVFGIPSLSFAMGSSSRQSVVLSDTASVHSTEVTPSLAASGLSSPVSTAFSPAIVAAPHLTTVLDNSSSDSASIVTGANSDPPPLPSTQGSAIAAIVNATRVMTADPASVLVDGGRDTEPLIARLAFELVKRARDENLTWRDPTRERRDRRTATEVDDGASSHGPVAVLSPPVTTPAEAIQTLSRALGSAGVASTEGFRSAKNAKRSAAAIMATAANPAPLFAGLMGGTTKAKPTSHTSDSQPAQPQAATPDPPPVAKKAPSVPLDAIISPLAKPPTQYLSRTYTPLTARDFRFTIPVPSATAARFKSVSEEGLPLTDRYGFVYDVAQYDVLLLVRAEECGCAAPACLTGVKIADREENEYEEDGDGDERRTIEIVRGECGCGGEEREEDKDEDDAMSIKSKSPSVKSKASKRLSVVSVSPPAAAPSSAVLAVTVDSPRHACAATVRKLLDSLTTLHDERQTVQRREWDVFVKQRGRARSSQVAKVVSGAATILGLGTSDEADELAHTEGLIGFAQMSSREDRKELDRLVRGGIPLVYRPKVWLECSGALEMTEPGLFNDLLAQNPEGNAPVLVEIEKDVGRTMPLNVFFGGDGAGVSKLRRVLIAYSRRNPAAKKKLFGTLAALIERILPEDFFSPSLLPSRACPLVLLDYVKEMHPKLHAHLAELGVDLPAICFSWFLSLFTDCLPIETLFRVWDVFLVDGLPVLFRTALAILRIGEAELLAAQSVPAVYVALENLPTRMWEGGRVLQMEAELRASVSKVDIEERCKVHVEGLRKLMAGGNKRNSEEEGINYL
ncbi:GTPase activating rab protein [Mycena chlorophos]|uniref:GTPase activating rab protein n=1 Tax=Mycena chlorophos TaxID=658473 RepID=A0A8H6W9S7_MYCCL|nr:GTPase activating rab protein [Mycena chlorophos]